MKEKFLKIQFLVYAVLLYASAFVLESYLSGLKPDDIDASRVEKVLCQKESRIDSLLSWVSAEVDSEQRLVREGAIWLLDINMEYLKDEGLAVLVYDSDTLRYWSDNAVATDNIFSQSPLNNRIANLNNAWYDVKTMDYGKRKYVGLIFLKNKYNYNNKYLKNDFMPDFHLGSSLQVSLIPLTYGADIKGLDGKYLFSLVPTNTYDIDGYKFNVVGVLYLLSLVMVLLFLRGVISGLADSTGNSLKIILVIVGVVLSRVLLLLLKFPSNIYSLDFFDPVYFSGSGLFDTIGDFIVNVVVLFFVLHYIFILADYANVKDRVAAMSVTGRISVWAVAVIALISVFGYLMYVTRLLVGNSKISFLLNNFMSLDIFSASGILILVVITVTLIYVSVKVTEYFDYSLIRNSRRAVAIYLGVSLAASLLVWLIADMLAGMALLYVLLMLGTALLMHYQKGETVLYRYIFMLLIGAVFTCTLICVTTEDKTSAQCRNLATSPADSHDAIAELLINDISDKLQSDGMVTDFISRMNPQMRQSRLRDYLQRQYFNGYWSKYNLSIKILECASGEFFSQINDDFVRAVEEKGSVVNGSVFYFIDNPDGTISYYSPIKYTYQGKTVYLCVSLDSKPVPQELGYPELLIDDNIKPSLVDGYDYAQYHHGRKVSQNGTFSYDISDKVFLAKFSSQESDTIQVMEMGEYVHTIYHSGESTTVVSRKRFRFMDFVTQFAYLFVIFLVVMLIYLGIRLLITRNTDFSHQLKTRLVASLIMILLMSFVIICVGTVYMNVHKFRAQNATSIDEKVRSVYMEVSQRCADTVTFASQWNPNKVGAMDEYLTRLAHVFFIDINLYNADGMLVASSRPEVFKQGLTSVRMNPTAMQKFVIENKATFIQDEKIGNMTYASAYIPFYTHGDNLAAYINLPYFTKPEVLQREISTLIVSIINLYVVLMMICIVVAVIISERIVQPIKMIQSKMETIELGKNYEKIDYPEKDELGQLVTEYNRMVDKLDESAKLLAQGERESAWRTMARQVAHEIKNPLTPMKLSIQFLTRTWQQDDSNFGDKLSKVSNTLIQQIDTLSSIATSFSNFAKMPQPVAVPLNVVETLGNVVALYQNTENIDVTSDLGDHKEIICMLDKEQIIRVFVNIIKNATQAIPDGVRGKIHVTLSKESADKVVVRIADNGTGIPDEIREKLFTPNFTTKSAGSGLGLAMVKTMVENVKGTITFESEVGKGTTFIVTLPIKED